MPGRLPDSLLTDEAIELAAGSALAWITGLPEPDLRAWEVIFKAISSDGHPCGEFCTRVLQNILTGEGEPATEVDILALAWIMKSGGWDTIL
jgi:hypothetical protein